MRYYVKFIANGKKRGRRIGYVNSGRKSEQEILNEVFRIINAFCDQRGYNSPYIRIYNSGEETKFDVGSWSEFFSVRPKILLEEAL